MATTIPTCAVLTAGGTALQNYVTSFYNWWAANTGNFTLSNVVGGGTPTSWTATHTDGFQINFRVSGGTLLVMISPNGGISDSAAPGTPAGFFEVIGLPAPSSTATRCYVALYDDAIFFANAHSGLTYLINGFLVGRIGMPLQDQDVAAGIDGLGILANIPADSNGSSNNYWYTPVGNAAFRQSRLRVSPTLWTIGLTYSSGNLVSQFSTTRRFNPICLSGHPDGSTTAPTTTSSPVICLSKYTCFAGGTSDSAVPFTLNESAGSDQAWMSINALSASATRHRILWNKTVDPTP